MPETPKNFGFIPDEITPDHYIMGAAPLSQEILEPEGDWSDNLPAKDDLQSSLSFESMNCTVYGTINALQILAKRKFGFNLNWSERYVGVMADTTPVGNSPHKVIEVIRTTSGLIDDTLLPFTDLIKTWEQYYSPNPMSLYFISKGRDFLNEFKLGHEWVKDPTVAQDISVTQNMMMEALQSSPLGAGVFAWRLGPDGVYSMPAGSPINHWICIYGYVKGKYWLVLDSYDNTLKRLEWNAAFTFVKRYTMDLIPLQTGQNWVTDLIFKILKFITDIVTKII